MVFAFVISLAIQNEVLTFSYTPTVIETVNRTIPGANGHPQF
jgi:hypothetical protein